jgi:hypothetical protein
MGIKNIKKKYIRAGTSVCNTHKVITMKSIQ